jgi:hypothetical protein
MQSLKPSPGKPRPGRRSNVGFNLVGAVLMLRRLLNKREGFIRMLTWPLQMHNPNEGKAGLKKKMNLPVSRMRDPHEEQDESVKPFEILALGNDSQIGPSICAKSYSVMQIYFVSHDEQRAGILFGRNSKPCYYKILTAATPNLHF